MINKQANRSIECLISNCEHHCSGENFCSLNKIVIGTHEANPTQSQCTDCMSFKNRG